MFITEFICPVLVVILCFAIAIITLYGTYSGDNIVSIIGFIELVCILILIAFSAGIKTVEEKNEIKFNEPAETVEVQQQVQVIPEITYEPAELVECTELENGAYEMLFAVGESEVQLFSWIDMYAYPDDVPYLLTMDNKGTLNNPLDDEILVVWMDMN